MGEWSTGLDPRPIKAEQLTNKPSRRKLGREPRADDGAGERGIDGVGLEHVDPRVPKQVERVFRAARLEEAEVVVELAFATAGHALRQCDRRRHSGGVRVDVERPVEMRNPEAFQREGVIDGEVGPK